MKKASVLFLAMAGLFVTACSSSEEGTDENGTEEKVEQSVYNLDTENSSLAWKAQMSPDYGHNGTVELSEGSVTMTGDALDAGSFVIDMTSVKVLDLEGDKKTALEGHLTGTIVDETHPQNMFWNTPVYPTTTVELLSYQEGELELKVKVLDKEMTATVPATIKTDGDKTMISGEFSLNFGDLGIPGFMPNPEDGSQIGPNVDFTLNAVLTK